jgi:hypothetical protein
MSRSDQKETRVQFRLPVTDYPKTMFFNQVRVEQEEGFCLVHFGLVSGAGMPLDYYSCVLDSQTLENNKKSLLDYVGKVGRAPGKTRAAWQGLPMAMQVPLPGKGRDVVDIVAVSCRNNMAETCLCGFSYIGAAGPKPATEPLAAQPVALLRSRVETQVHWLIELYER